MSQGLFTAVSGIRTNQSKIDVISDNIANMNTVGFKSSQVNFENVFVRTLTSGSTPSTNIGGTNPMQVGLGATIGEITRNFTGGNVQSTGRSTDLNIQGTGFFTLQNSEGALVLTRAGNFSLDSQGFLVNPKGMKVIGTDSVSSTTGSSTAIRIPQSLRLETSISPVTGTELVGNLDGVTVKPGTFTIRTGSGVTGSINVASNSTIANIRDAINADANLSGAGVVASISATGEFSIAIPDTDTLDLEGDPNDTCTFLDATGLSAALETDSGTDHTYTSPVLRANSVTIRPSDSTVNTFSLTSFSVGKDGAVEATYANGDKITVTGEPTKSLLYKTSTGRDISGSGITVLANAVRPIEMQIQLANVINPKGLVSQGGNIFTVGPNAGYATFSTGSGGGMGTIDSGALESSNVDLPSEFAEMILAQRGIDANSRTFNTQNQIMSVIVNLGRG